MRMIMRFENPKLRKTNSSFDGDKSIMSICIHRKMPMGLHHWQCRNGGAQKKPKKNPGKDSVIEGQPLLLFM
jgi:hypothetical protein